MIEAGMVSRAKLDFLQGVHQPGDDYRIALYTEAASLGPNTTKYTKVAEVRGQGYEVAGAKLKGYSSGIIDSAAYISFNTVDWPNSSIEAKGAMIYNASKDNAAIVIIDFDTVQKSSIGLFRVEFPEPSEYGAVIWIG
jgi:hypothetical protein